MYSVIVSKAFHRRLGALPGHLQRRIDEKIIEVAANPYAPNNNVKRLQGIDAYRLRVGDWRILYQLQDERLIMLVLEMDTRGGIYK